MSEHLLCLIYSARGQGSGKWEKKDNAKLVVEDAGDITTEEEQPDFNYNSGQKRSFIPAAHNYQGREMLCLEDA